jgi:hypothetical protein
MPPARRRISPARSISWWLMISASEGASLRVAMKNWLARMVIGWNPESAHFTRHREFAAGTEAAFQRRAIVKECVPVNHWNMHHARS